MWAIQRKKKKIKTVKISIQMEWRLEKPAQFFEYEILFELWHLLQIAHNNHLNRQHKNEFVCNF